MDFGFKLQPSSTINLDNVDMTLYQKLVKMEPDIKICMACGSCGATCTASPFSGMSVRKFVLDVQRGRNKEAAAMVKNCMLCGKCLMVCPRGINTRHLILSFCRIYQESER
ncbi:MAG: 4Fe-4S dicluster domain-containing protein [Bacteroidales bacterium]|nr:4Fe-4S dicluster domain-containing protein [Bacteroidales bacterium]